MKIFWVVKARTLMLSLVACFAVLLVVYSWSHAATPVFPWGGKDVFFMGHQLDVNAPDLEEQVIRLTQGLNQPPLDAEYDSVNKSVIPEINGFEISVGETVEAIKSARKNENVAPIWREVKPEVTIADFSELPIYNGNPIKKEISLVINVSWGNEYLVEMLEILDQQGVLASFFLVGRWAEENPELVQQIVDAGHDLGNHGYSDPHMKDLSPDAIKEEINKTNSVVQQITGVEMQWFSPPYGEKVEKIYQAAAQLDMHTVLWSLDTVDWMLPGEDVMVDRILGNLHNGAIILMHPTEQTPGALKRIIEGAKEQGYHSVTVSEILNPSYWLSQYNSLWMGN